MNWLPQGPASCCMVSRNLFQSMPDANLTPELPHGWRSGHFENNCRLLAANPYLDAV
jgi:hypothetical protein